MKEMTEPQRRRRKASIGPITPVPSWKLYDNPFYHRTNAYHPQPPSHHRLYPLSARKLGASLWDLQPIPIFQTMDSQDISRSHRRLKALEEQHVRTLSLVSALQSELDLARGRINELKAIVQTGRGELEIERKTRRKMETLNKRLAKEVSEAKLVITENLSELVKERKNREVMEGVCDELAKEIGADRAELEEMRRECNRAREEVEEERKMMRIAEVWREERVQMILAEARLLLEEKLLDLERQRTQVSAPDLELETTKTITQLGNSVVVADCSSFAGEEISVGENGGSGLCRSSSMNGDIMGGSSPARNSIPIQFSQRRVSADTENPHIRRGIKGFVEFPRVVRAGASRGRQLGSKHECRKAQLRLIMKHKSPAG